MKQTYRTRDNHGMRRSNVEPVAADGIHHLYDLGALMWFLRKLSAGR